ncbi:hypothetical protein D3C78_1468320 [compost metagenome]
MLLMSLLAVSCALPPAWITAGAIDSPLPWTTNGWLIPGNSDGLSLLISVAKAASSTGAPAGLDRLKSCTAWDSWLY